MFVTGKAGTGKSTLIHWLRGQLNSCAVVAPTAVAASAIQGDTIHSFFGIPPRLVDPEEPFSSTARMRLVLANISCLIVDEVSMVLPNLVDVMNKILQSARGNRQPFGGVPVIFVGDLLQLPPVVASQEEMVYFSHRYKTPYFFSADIFRTQKIVSVGLSKVRRQADSEFVEALNRLRVNDNPRESVALFNRSCFRDKPASRAIGVYLVPTNQRARAINMRELDRLEGVPRVYEARVTGTIPVNGWKLPVTDRLELKIGAKVLFVKNCKPKWINGDLGTVVGFEADRIQIRKDETGNVLVVARETWHKYKYTYDYQTRKVQAEIVGDFEQFPLALGWAITIHKAQGLSLDRLTLDLGDGAFEGGQTYVALSRARTMDGISLVRPIRMGDVRVDPVAIEFYRQLDLCG